MHPSHLIDEVIHGNCRDPFAFLGMHQVDDRLTVRAFLPGAHRVELIDSSIDAVVGEMTLTHDWGFFTYDFEEGANRFPYRFRADFDVGRLDLEDPYRFSPVWGDMDSYLFMEGRHWNLYDRLGAHQCEVDGAQGVLFAVWAPNAQRVSVVGSFNNWDGRRHPMRLRIECGIWELFIPQAHPGDLYKFEIRNQGGDLMPLKSDPFAMACEPPPGNSAIVIGPSQHEWTDGAWMEERAQRDFYHTPMSIYEVHLGSWKRSPDEGNRYLTYREMADQLVPYVADLGFTHIELLPISEHPFDPSWGYQPVGMFAPTYRFGSPDDLRYFIDRCHQAGIGVLMDWVPGHFPTDEHGLGNFDGTSLYEHSDPRQGYHPDWNTLIYNYGRAEVAVYLISNALYWIKEFHLDGLRVDAVASMLYSDYSRQDGQWIPNKWGGNENLEAIEFLKVLNHEVYAQCPGAITIAEESTSWPMVSKPTDMGGLGFGFKWNMGWMNDTLAYMRKDPVHRRYYHNQLTFGMLYGYHENFILPLSHDEVVHGKCSLLDQMPGDAWQKFANLRCYFTFYFAYPGKKLLFMGGEFGQGREWNHQQSLDWHLLEEVPFHQGLWKAVRDLNRLYANSPALHELDHEPGGFEWLNCHDHEQSVISWQRTGRQWHPMMVLCNFTPVVREGYRIGVPAPGVYKELFNSDAIEYGGSGQGNNGAVTAEEIPMHHHPYSISVTLPPLSGLILMPESVPEPAPVEEHAPEPAPEPEAHAEDAGGDDDQIVCQICGKGFKALPRHLTKTHGVDAAGYRERFGLPEDFPLEAPSAVRKRKGKGKV